ncbi:hypothetical protein [uncultured Roseibium sp.]|uniref:hypothetical protein n=1 Tax=uncultured Roseibium sp. TaxID=1936171 RepID=UPI003217FDD3
MTRKAPGRYLPGRACRVVLRSAFFSLAVFLGQVCVSFGLLPSDGNRAEAAFKAVNQGNPDDNLNGVSAGSRASERLVRLQ